jgi:hypothetical protein
MPASCERKIANLLWSSQRVGLAVEAAEALHLLPDCDSFRLTPRRALNFGRSAMRH